MPAEPAAAYLKTQFGCTTTSVLCYFPSRESSFQRELPNHPASSSTDHCVLTSGRPLLPLYYYCSTKLQHKISYPISCAIPRTHTLLSPPARGRKRLDLAVFSLIGLLQCKAPARRRPPPHKAFLPVLDLQYAVNLVLSPGPDLLPFNAPFSQIHARVCVCQGHMSSYFPLCPRKCIHF